MTAAARADMHRPVATAYSFGDGVPPAIWLGLGPARLTTLTAGLLAAVAALLVGLPIPMAAVPAGLAATAALLQLAGRPAVGWFAPLAGHAGAAVTGRGRWCRPPPATVLTGAGTARPVPADPEPVRLPLPAEYGRQFLLAPDPTRDDDSVCCLHEPATGTLTVAFDVAGVDRYPLLDPAEQDQLLTGWGEALTCLGRDPDLLRLQLLDRTRPAPSPPDPGSDDETGDGAAAHHDLAAMLARISTSRDSLLVVQLRAAAFGPAGPAAARRAGAHRRAGTDRIDLAAVTGRARQFAAAVLAAQLVLRPLPAGQLLALFTDLLTPTADSYRCGDGLAAAGRGNWGGLSRRCGWDHVRIADSWHRSFAVSGWPATAVAGSWLAPLLLTAPAGAARTLAVHLQPLSAADAARAARAVRTRAELDRADRFRLGLAAAAQADRAAESSSDLDTDLVAGHSALRLSAVLTVTAADLAGLAEADRQLQQAAAAARLLLRPLHGQHHLALAATVPLCRARTAGAL